ncbi:MAG: hypothetical protein OXM87_03370 [Truepera sp.]|nr:hypothetical protein [Truepera sp.]
MPEGPNDKQERETKTPIPIEIDFGDQLPAGVVLAAADPGDEHVPAATSGFTSTVDGQAFIRLLEGWPEDVLQRLPPQKRVVPSQVDHMLVVCRRDGKADVFINNLELIFHARASRSIKAGEGVTKDDVADIERFELGVPIPDDAGFLFLFSVGWRKGFVFDFGPILPTEIPKESDCQPRQYQPRQYDITAVLTQVFSQVLFQERLSISDDEWNALFAAKWFPFVGLGNDKIDSLLNHIRSGWNPDEMLDEIAAMIKERIPKMLDSWRRKPSFSPHMEILERALERFQDDDFVSCTGLLFPRIEGMLRTYHSSLGQKKKPSPQNLSASAVASKIENEGSLLLPRQFLKYLREVYFAYFDPNTEKIGVSRHSVGHGVAPVEEFNRKSSVISILMINQLFYLFRKQVVT